LLVLEFWFNLLEDVDIQDIVFDALFHSGYSSRLIVHSNVQSRRSLCNSEKLTGIVYANASLRDSPDVLKRLYNFIKKAPTEY
ncbi:hypothetical protein ACJ73_10132, partial [Blastomyces percursus]